jgi:hypothetical protein
MPRYSLEVLIAVLIALWLAGLTLRVAGGFIHILLLFVLVAIVLRFLQGQRS